MGVLALVILVAFTVVGLGIIGYALLERRWVGEFAGRALTVPATVERLKATSSARSSRPGPVVLRYRAVVTFRRTGGAVQRATTRWPTTTRPAVGSTIPVRYDPVRPKRVVPAAGEGSAPPSTALVVTVGVVAIVFGWVVSSVLRAIA
ncbi:hypothetical protein ACXR2U_10910 [Jatrophihabitans sp. YIM 134969]